MVGRVDRGRRLQEDYILAAFQLLHFSSFGHRHKSTFLLCGLYAPSCQLWQGLANISHIFAMQAYLQAWWKMKFANARKTGWGHFGICILKVHLRINWRWLWAWYGFGESPPAAQWWKSKALDLRLLAVQMRSCRFSVHCCASGNSLKGIATEVLVQVITSSVNL